jgi:mono/diheme cytochrome c family protein
MSKDLVLGLFKEPAPVATAIEELRLLNVPEQDITVMSGIPYEPQMLGRPPIRGRLTWLTLRGAVLALITGLMLTVGTYLLYPLFQGGQPLVPLPPSLIILFEITMLGVMWAAFFGFVVLNRFPVFGRPAYDPRITAGEIGLLAKLDAQWTARAEAIFRQAGAHDVQHLKNGKRVHRGDWLLVMAGVVALLVIGAGASLLVFYEVIELPIPSQMVNQESIGYEQGPRLAAPVQAVPVQGPVLIAGQPASEPVPATANSLQRGEVLFGINCAVCHGKGGTGDGPLSHFFSPGPADLTSDDVQSLSEEVVFLVITNGRGTMPGLEENLSVVDTWDIVKHVGTLRK